MHIHLQSHSCASRHKNLPKGHERIYTFINFLCAGALFSGLQHPEMANWIMLKSIRVLLSAAPSGCERDSSLLTVSHGGIQMSFKAVILQLKDHMVLLSIKKRTLHSFASLLHSILHSIDLALKALGVRAHETEGAGGCRPVCVCVLCSALVCLRSPHRETSRARQRWERLHAEEQSVLKLSPGCTALVYFLSFLDAHQLTYKVSKRSKKACLPDVFSLHTHRKHTTNNTKNV